VSRLVAPYGFTPTALRGLWTREQRFYFLQSLACQPNPDQACAKQLLAIAAAARQGGDVQQAPGEAPQSGGIAASPKL
jgi:hypothetical protein